MFEWLRDTLGNTSSSLSHRHSMIPSHFFRQQQNPKKNEKRFSPSEDDDDNETDEESNDNSFYHNPYHSSGQMNYVDLPQQQYTNQHNYPTYLAQQQQTLYQTTNTSIDQQIHTKLLLLQQRGSQFQSYTQRQYDYTYRNRILPTPRVSFTSNTNRETNIINEEHLGKEEDVIPKDDDDYGISVYYPGQYPNLDEHFDLASVVLWYRNVMQSVKKLM